MDTNQNHTLKLLANFEKPFSSLYAEISSCSSETIRVEFYIKLEDPSGEMTDILMFLFQNIPTMKELVIEGYEYLCYPAAIHPPKYNLFYKFAEFVEDYVKTAQTQACCKSVEKMEFKRCFITEEDLKVLSASIFPNLKQVYFYHCSPHGLRERQKYEDILPNVKWEDDYYDQSNTGDKNRLVHIEDQL